MTETLERPETESERPRRRKDDVVADGDRTLPRAVPIVEIAIPVYNEEQVIESSVRRLRTFLDTSFPFSASIVVVDNASVDRTSEILERLTAEIPGVSAIHLDQKGKGRAVRAAWTASRSPIVAYMDADLSTDLDGLLPLVAPLISGHSQVAIGSRTATGARVLRGGKREFISRTYNLLLRCSLRCRFTDAQCGFKAMRRDAVDPLMAMIEDEHWFFDTELLMQAERSGLRIHEVSVDWIDDPDTRVNIGGAMKDDLRGVWRMARRRRESQQLGRSGVDGVRASTFDNHRELARYTGVGALSTITYLMLFLLLKGRLGVFSANLVAAAFASIGNTTAHALFTFRSQRPGQTRRAIFVGVGSFALAIGLTSLTLATTYLLGRSSPATEVVAIMAGMVAAACVRFVLLREWAFRTHARALRAGASSTRRDDDPDLASLAA